MKVFINETGMFLAFARHASKPQWDYCWVASINDATVADEVPRNVRWTGQKHPSADVVISVEVEVVVTRTVTIVKIKDS